MLAAFALAAAGLLMGARPADVAVVLGNTVQADGRPSPRLAARPDRAADCYAAPQCRILFVSGGVDPGGADEAAVMRDYLLARGVPADRIVTDSAGVDSWSTARHASAYMRAQGDTRALAWRSCRQTECVEQPKDPDAVQIFHNPVHDKHAGRQEMFRGKLVPCHETPARLEYVLDALRQRGIGDLLAPSAPDMDLIKRVHTPRYVDFLASAWRDWVALDPANADIDILPSVWPVRGFRHDIEPTNFAARPAPSTPRAPSPPPVAPVPPWH
ncbi:hypothetical protein G6F31_013842 [Rhizopus arrhizus]|nr:hypothetical protein G6F31_013842 [Rhizopus arrhizus]